MIQDIVINNIQAKAIMIRYSEKADEWFLLATPIPSDIDKIVLQLSSVLQNKSITSNTLMKMKKNRLSIRPIYHTGFVCPMNLNDRVEFEPHMESFIKEDGKDTRSLCVKDLKNDIYSYEFSCEVTYEDVEWNTEDKNAESGGFYYEKIRGRINAPIKITGYGNSR
jgi:hypothetical protein